MTREAQQNKQTCKTDNLRRFLIRIREFLNSYSFYAIETFIACIFTLFGKEVQGAVFFVALISMILLVCDDILPTTLPFLLLCAFTTNCYDSFDTFFPYIKYVPVVAACVIFHFTVYRKPMRIGYSYYGIAAVTIAVMLGGIGRFSLKDYAYGAYYYLGLGIGMVAVYFLIKSQLDAHNDKNYDLRHRFCVIMTMLGVMCVVIIAVGYLKLDFGYISKEDLYPKGFSRNNISTLLMFSMPFPLFLALKKRYYAIYAWIFYAAITLTTSRGGLIFGSIEFLACIIYWIFSGKKHIIYLLCAMGAIALLAILFHNVIIKIIRHRIICNDITDEIRYNMIKEAIARFKKNPLFGSGILDDSISYGSIKKKGAMTWYHMMVPQVMGSMGLTGIIAYGYQFIGRLRLIFRKCNYWSLCLGISYLGILGMSQVNPGEFCPLPFELLTVMLFIFQEQRMGKKLSQSIPKLSAPIK